MNLLIKRFFQERIKRFVKTVFFDKNFVWKALFVLSVLSLFILNSLHEKYPDEFDNILGGWYILHGKLPYVGFFTHHGPVPYFIASFLLLFVGQSFVRFRIAYALLLSCVIFGTYLLLKKRVGKKQLKFFPVFIIFLAFESTYYWVQMLLADNIAAFSFLLAFSLIFLKAFYNKTITLIDFVIVSIASAIGLYASLAYSYLYMLTITALIYLYIKDHYKILLKNKLKMIIYPLSIIIAPHIIYFLYLLITRSLSDYIFQNFIFNARYYIYNYPRPPSSTAINPIRYAIVILNEFLNNFYTLLLGIKNFDFVFPMNITMAVGNIGTCIFLILSKRYKLSLCLFLVMVYTNVRSNPLSSAETDYQSAVYIMISFFIIFFLLPSLYSSLQSGIAIGKKIVFGFLLIIVGVYASFAVFFIILKFDHKFYAKYMGSAPLIYDRPLVSPIINSITDKNDLVWIGPFEFEELFYTKAKVPGKFHILIGGIGSSVELQNQMLNTFREEKPKIIYFNTGFTYLFVPVTSYGKFFIDFLNNNYTTLFNYKDRNIVYRASNVDSKIDIEAKLYLRKDAVEDVIQKLLDKGYIKQVVEKSL